MRLGIVRGHVILGAALPSLKGTRLLLVEPITAESLAAGAEAGGGKCLVVADHLGPHVGQRVAFVEGREAANPFWPQPVPVDAYCALIVERADFRPPQTQTSPSAQGVQR